MTFSSISFVIFFLTVLILLVIVQHSKANDFKKNRLCHVLLLIASYVFYGWWDWRFCFLLFGVTAISFLCAVEKQNTADPMQKARFVFGIVTPLVVLGIFKYANFFIDSFCAVFHIRNSTSLQIILPVGISFFTFQALSYNIDVYYGKLQKESSFLKYSLYISFFPQLVAGPIVKASEFLPQLNENRRVELSNLSSGIQIFVFGLFKKLVIADNLSVFVDDVYRAPTLFGTFTVWLAVISYAIQIYFDFSGYSDMAIGCAKCIGYDLSKNFDLPYISRNVSEFWKRWHISLSSWLQQYLYIPLGGNRRGTVRTYINLMLTMLLGGLWHGSSWTFVIWGGLHGLALCVHKLYLRFFGKKSKASKLSTLISVVFTDLFVVICWVFFRAETLDDAFVIIGRMFVLHDGIRQIYSWSIVSVLLVIAADLIIIRKSGKTLQQGVHSFYPEADLNTVSGLTVLFTVILLILGLAYVEGNPFVYFQF